MMQKVMSCAVVVLVAACGGHKPATSNDVSKPLIDTSATSGDTTDHSGNMIPPEKMDEVQRNLKRKSLIISRCLADAVEAGTMPKGSHGKVTVELVVTPAGTAQRVRVVKSSLNSTEVEGCVTRHVEETEFPKLPRQLETSFTYAMEAN